LQPGCNAAIWNGAHEIRGGEGHASEVCGRRGLRRAGWRQDRLRHHFEQNFHVRHRLDRYGAGRCPDYDKTGPEALAHAIAAEIGRPVSYRPVETDGAARAAALLSELI
jgi:hypothetical protein